VTSGRDLGPCGVWAHAVTKSYIDTHIPPSHRTHNGCQAHGTHTHDTHARGQRSRFAASGSSYKYTAVTAPDATGASDGRARAAAIEFAVPARRPPARATVVVGILSYVDDCGP